MKNYGAPVIVLLTLIIIPINTSAQTYIKYYNSSDVNYSAYVGCEIDYDNTSNALIIGTLNYNGTYLPGVMKTDTCGNPLWARQVGTAGQGIMCTAYSSSIVNGNYSIYYWQDNGSRYGTVANFNVNGRLSSSGSFHATNANAASLVEKGRRLSNGDHLVVGKANNGTIDHASWLTRLSPTGFPIWSITSSGNSGGYNCFYGLDENTATGELYAIGEDVSFSRNNSKDIHLIKTTAAGIVLWEKQFSTPGTDFGHCVKVLPDNGVLIAVTTDWSINSNPCIALIRLDALGNIIWQNYYNSARFESTPKEINILPNGNFLITGYTNSFGPPNTNGLLMEVNDSGNIVWQRTYGDATNSHFRSSEIIGNAIYSLGNYDVSGTNGQNRVWLVKTHLDGTFDSASQCNSSPCGFIPTPIVFNSFDTSNVITGFAPEPLAFASNSTSLIPTTMCGNPTASFTPETSICVNQSISLTDQSLNSVSSWTWSSTAHNITNPTIQHQAPVTFSVAGTYTIQLKVSSCVAIDSISKVIVVHAQPTVTAFNNGPLCVGSTLSLSCNAGTTYTWSGPAGFSSHLKNPVITMVDTAASGHYTVMVSAGSCSISTTTTTVRIKPTPIISVSGDSVVCQGHSTFLVATGGASYLWSSGQTLPSITVTPSVNTTYTVIGFDSGIGCSSQATIKVNDLPTIAISGPDSVCLNVNNQNITLTASGAYTYTWNTAATEHTTVVTPTVTTHYSVSGSDAITGCVGIANHTVYVGNVPVLVISGDTVICQGQQCALVANGANTYQWSTGGKHHSIIIIPTVSDTITLTGINPFGCSEQRSIIIKVNPTTEAHFTTDSVLADCIYYYNLIGIKNNLITDYDWSVNGAHTSNDNVWLSLEQNQTQKIILTVTNKYGCKDDIGRTITTDDLYANLIYAPNAFTPNSDGLNDAWKIVGECLEQVTCSI